MIEINAMFPVMVSAELSELKRFYESVFGFSTVFHDPEFYLHLLEPRSGVQLGFLVPEHASQPAFLHHTMVKDGYVISLEVADAESAYNTAKAMSLDITLQLVDEVWGQRHFIVTDPAGFRVDVVQHLQEE